MLNIETDADLSELNSFALAARAEFFVRVRSEAELVAACHWAEERKLPLLLLGGGSNLVLAAQVPGLVIQVDLRGWTVETTGEAQVSVTIGAGNNWHATVQRALDEGLFGLENLALIPGTVGAAPVQNIGAYGVEIGDLLESIRCFDREQRSWRELSKAQCQFGYRDSLFKRYPGRFLISWVRLRLSRNFSANFRYAALQQALQDQGVDTPSPQQLFDAVCQVRRAKLPDPKQLGNAGSFFKNPVVTREKYLQLAQAYPQMPAYSDPHGMKLAAGWLIEQAGLKGFTQGCVGVHRLQALVLVNYGGAQRQDIEALAAKVRSEVETKFGVCLEQEPIAYP